VVNLKHYSIIPFNTTLCKLWCNCRIIYIIPDPDLTLPDPTLPNPRSDPTRAPRNCSQSSSCGWYHIWRSDCRDVTSSWDGFRILEATTLLWLHLPIVVSVCAAVLYVAPPFSPPVLSATTSVGGVVSIGFSFLLRLWVLCALRGRLCMKMWCFLCSKYQHSSGGTVFLFLGWSLCSTWYVYLLHGRIVLLSWG
jgi:hypothetical protein